MACVSLLGACSTAPQAHLPLLRGWVDGLQVLYVTTDASDAGVAMAKQANFAPVLARAVLDEQDKALGRRAATDRVYASVNFNQPSVFGSGPSPVGPGSRDPAYSPLWQMVRVTWLDPQRAHELRSEEAILAAADAGELALEVTRFVLNCPIIYREGLGGLPGVSFDRPR